MVMEKAREAVEPSGSVAVTVKLNGPLAVGVPETTPLLEIDMPAGSAPAVRAKLNAPDPPVALSACPA